MPIRRPLVALKSFASLAALASVALLVTGCDDKPAAAPGTGASAAASSAPAVASASVSAAPSPVLSGALRQRRRMRHGGVAETFLATASEMTTLKPDQLTKIETLDEALHGEPASMGTEAKAFHTELVAEVRAGKIDATKLAPLSDAVDNAMSARTEKVATALAGLHDLLDPAQRKALTEAIRGHQTQHDALDAGAAGHTKPEEWHKNKLVRLTRELALDDAQQKQVEALLAKNATSQADLDAMKDAHAKRREALLVAFEGETFDPKKFELGPVEKKGRGLIEHEVGFLTQLLPLLKPEQTVKLATVMDRPHGHGAGSGWGPRKTPFDILEDGDAQGMPPGMMPRMPMPAPIAPAPSGSAHP